MVIRTVFKYDLLRPEANCFVLFSGPYNETKRIPVVEGLHIPFRTSI